MLQLIFLIIIIYCIVKAVNNSKKKKTTTTSKPTTASRPATTPKSATKATKPPVGDDALSKVDHDAFARAMAAMSGDAPKAEAARKATPTDDAAARKWVREHAFTDYLCNFYARCWGPEGSVYQRIVAGELPIVRLELQVQADKIVEILHLQDGGNFDSDSTFESFEYDGKYTRLDSAAQRDELIQCIREALSKLPTISVKADGFHVLTGAAVTAPKKEEPKPETPAAGEDALSHVDHDAFARAMAAMSGDASAPKADAPKKEEPKKEAPKPTAPAADYDAFLKKILDYYHSMWNKENGSLYTELDSTMPIDHFAIQVRENCLVESVWLQGDDIPLVTETPYTKLCGDVAVYPMADAQEQTKLLVAIAKLLVELGTVEVKGNDFYPIRTKKAAAPKAGASKTEGEFSESAQEAALRAQVQAMLEQQKKDDDKK